VKLLFKKQPLSCINDAQSGWVWCDINVTWFTTQNVDMASWSELMHDAWCMMTPNDPGPYRHCIIMWVPPLIGITYKASGWMKYFRRSTLPPFVALLPVLLGLRLAFLQWRRPLSFPFSPLSLSPPFALLPSQVDRMYRTLLSVMLTLVCLSTCS
jgi:hypothetical protein